MENTTSNDYIDLLAIFSRFFRFVKVFWPAILLLSLVLTGTFGAVALKPPTRKYSTHIVFTYGVKPGTSAEFNYTLTGLARGIDINLISRSMQSMLGTELFRENLMEKLDTDSLNTSLSISFTPGTNLGILYSDSTDKEEVTAALDAALEILPGVLRPVTGPIEIQTQGSADEVQESVEGLPLIPLAAAGFAGGLFAGFGLLGLAAFAKQEISSEAEIFNALSIKTLGKLPFLNRKGSIPIFGTLRYKGFLPRLSVKKSPELIETKDYQDNLRLISAQIIERMKNDGFQSLLIISTKKSEGKTTFTNSLKKELVDASWNVTLIEDFEQFRDRPALPSDNEFLLLDFPEATTSGIGIMEATELADAYLLIVRSDTVLPKDAKWGLHFIKNCHAVCIGAVLNACI